MVSTIFENPSEEPKQKRVSVMMNGPPEDASSAALVKEISGRASCPRKSIRRSVATDRPSRLMKFSTRLNTSYKWKEDMTVIGALEVASEPRLDVRAKLTEKPQGERHSEFAECLRVWEELKLRKSFIEACESVSPSTSCCGLVQDHTQHVRDLACILNEGWAKAATKQVKSLSFKISVFVWTWTNASGPGETVVMLIRFHSIGTLKLGLSGGGADSSSSTVEPNPERPGSAASFKDFPSTFKM
jgi:hypothetical protein